MTSVTRETPSVQPSAVRAIASKDGRRGYVLMDVLAQMLPNSTELERKEHLQAFRERDKLQLFEKMYWPRARQEDPRKRANLEVGGAAIVTDLIASVPGEPQNLREQAQKLLRHWGQDLSTPFAHRPLKARPLTPEEKRQQMLALVQAARARAAEVPQRTRNHEEICERVLSNLPAGAEPATGLLRYSGRIIHLLRDETQQMWFRGTAVAEVLGHTDAKEAIRQHVARARKQKRSMFPHGPLPKAELETWWLNAAGVQDLVDAASNKEGAACFCQWMSTVLAPEGNNESVGHVVQSAEDPEDLDVAAALQEIATGARIDTMRKRAEWQILQLALANMAEDACSRFGLQLPPELQPEHLLRQALVPEAATLTETVDESLRAIDLQHERNLRAHSKLLMVQAALEARNLADRCGRAVTEAQLLQERRALEMAATPPYLDEGGWLMARDYLELRGHTAQEVKDLESAFGKYLKVMWREEHGTEPETVLRDYPGAVDTPSCRYHRSRDVALLNASYKAFSLTETYRKRVASATQAINNL